MRKTRRLVNFLILILLAWPAGTPLFAGGDRENSSTRNGLETPAVFVSIQPQAFFVERIAGERVRAEVLVKPGQDPHTFEPTPQQMARLAQARAFFRIGVEFENALMPRIESTMGELMIVDCREGIPLRPMDTHQHEGEEHHEEEHAGEHEGADPHIWLSVANALRIAETIHRALLRLDPEGAAAYQTGYSRLVEDLRALDRRIAEILAPVEGEPLFVFHPSFGYFADDYGLLQIAVETGGAEPSARQLARLIEQARAAGVRVIFVQPQFSQKSAETIAAEIGGSVVPIDPLAGDYIENLERMARAVEEGLR
jgi:zinc transport system substrate-binding protein